MVSRTCAYVDEKIAPIWIGRCNGALHSKHLKLEKLYSSRENVGNILRIPG